VEGAPFNVPVSGTPKRLQLGEDTYCSAPVHPEVVQRLRVISAKYNLPVVIFAMLAMETCTQIFYSTGGSRTMA